MSLVGRYHNPWWNAFTRTWYRIGEHARVALCHQNVIRCELCRQVYDSYDFDGRGTMQGHDLCAWALFEQGRWVIHCGYGSSFDLSEFWFIDQYPTSPIRAICDWCIRRMLRDGIIINSGKELSID